MIRSFGQIAAIGHLDAVLIRRLRDAVLGRVNPRLLILFGSQAKGIEHHREEGADDVHPGEKVALCDRVFSSLSRPHRRFALSM